MNSTNSPQTHKQAKPPLSRSSQLFPITYTNKIKPVFRDKIEWRCLMPSDITYINKYKPKMLSSVELKGLEFQKINGVRNLCKALIGTKRISSLFIEPSRDCKNFTKFGHLLRTTNRWKKLIVKYPDHLDKEEAYFNTEKFKALVRLRRCTYLSVLNLSFACSSLVESELLEYLSLELQWLPSLKILAIDMGSYYSYPYRNPERDKNNDPNFSILKFKYPRYLTFLRLNFREEGSISAKGLHTFAADIQRCHFLNYIDLDFQRLSHRVDYPEAQIWTSLAQKTSSLKTLKIKKILYNHESDSEFQSKKAYLESFQHLGTLENLILDFDFSLSEENNQIFSPIFFSHLASFTNLKYLNITFSCFNSHLGFLNLLAFQSFSQLKHLRLNFEHCENINNKTLEDLAQKFASLTTLQSFEFIFPKTSSITNEGIIAFSFGFKPLTRLNNLTLNFKHMLISHKAIEIVSNNTAHLSLTSLHILLGRQQPEIPTKTFFQKPSTFSKPVKRLTALFSAIYCFNSRDNLSLNLMGFSICTKEWKHFALALKELTHLRSLSLDLPQFDSENSDEGLRRFLSSLKQLKKLYSLRLNFFGTKLCNKQIELLFSNIQGCHKSLENLELSSADPEELGDATLESLGFGLQNFKALKKLSVLIREETVFSQEAVIGLLRRLTVLKELEILDLRISFSTSHPEVRTILMNIVNYQNFRRLKQFTANRYRIRPFLHFEGQTLFPIPRGFW